MPRRTNQLQQLIHSIHIQLYHDAKVIEPITSVIVHMGESER